MMGLFFLYLCLLLLPGPFMSSNVNFSELFFTFFIFSSFHSVVRVHSLNLTKDTLTNMPRKESAMNLLSQNSHEPLFNVEERIEFVRATTAATGWNATATTSTHSNTSTNNNGRVDENALPQMMAEADDFPRVSVADWLYKADDVRKLCTRLHWSKARQHGPGLDNIGNTCFLNVVLQCLTYTASLAEVALHSEEEPNDINSSTRSSNKHKNT